MLRTTYAWLWRAHFPYTVVQQRYEERGLRYHSMQNHCNMLGQL